MVVSLQRIRKRSNPGSAPVYYLELEHVEDSHSFIFEVTENIALRIVAAWPHNERPGFSEGETYYEPKNSDQ